MTNNEMSMLITRGLNKLSRVCQKAINQRKAYDYPHVAYGVEAYPLPVLGSDSTGSMFDPYVMLTDKGQLAMYVSCRNDGSIERWDSIDGLTWTKIGVSLAGKSDVSSWDSTVNRACVIQEGSRWLMWFTGQCNGTSAIGFAASDDGISFERQSDAPVLLPTLAHEGTSLMNPWVSKTNDGRYRMWYAAGEDYEPDVICHAMSPDGIHWEKAHDYVLSNGNEPCDSYKVGGCSVINLGCDNLAMFYIGYQNLDVARICMAFSDDDGQTWQRSKANPLVGPERDAWDAHAVYKPSALLLADGSVRLWYNARRNNHEYIGTAIIRNIGDLLV